MITEQSPLQRLSPYLQALQQQYAALQNELKASQEREAGLRDQLSKVEPGAETGSLAQIKSAGVGAESEPERATAMLSLAMQLHDQYVDKGKAKNAQLVSEGESQRNTLITEGEQKRAELIAEAEAYSQQTRNSADEYAKNTETDADSYSEKTHKEADEYSKRVHDEVERYDQQTRKAADEYDSRTREAAERHAAEVREKLYKDSKIIEGNIEGLKQFESEYRSRLTEFLSKLSTQVSDVNNYDTMSSNGNGPEKYSVNDIR